METNQIPTYLKFAGLQMAAEAIYPVGYTQGPVDKSTLTGGNSRRSQFTNVLADQFIADGWTVVDHKKDTGTGFSGTLFRYGGPTDLSRDLTNGELVLSFRSTEFIDDSARDSVATNQLEISKTGWAFGQIADMQDWFNQLNADPAMLQGKNFSVTGYSLGGHLATAFNVLMVDAGSASRITATYTFNGAGVGDIDDGHTLTEAVGLFRVGKAFGNADYFTDAAVRGLYLTLVASLDAVTPSAAQIAGAVSQVSNARALAKEQPYSPQRTVKLGEFDTLYLALTRVQNVYGEADRIKATISSGSGSAAATPVDQSEIDAVKLDYQLAVLRASSLTKPFLTGVKDSYGVAYDPIRTELALVGASPIYDIYGAPLPSAVANSQNHYGRGIPVFIEDQPLGRGLIVGQVLVDRLITGEVKLLQSGFEKNDFGDTHSLVLLI
ncbi:MAG: lipase family protein, partial [Caldimonas sp.]